MTKNRRSQTTSSSPPSTKPSSQWWGAHGDYNIAIATGPGSGVWVLDVDSDEGERTLRRLEAQHGRLPPTVEATTGSGRHLYFRWPADLGIEIRNSQVRDDIPGLDVRGGGGYVLAPPSIHPNGRRYAWSVDSADAFADAPDWLIDIAAGRNRADAAGEPVPTPPEAWRAFVFNAHEGSRREAAIARLAGYLFRKYVDPYVVLALCQSFNRDRCFEPLARAEVARIVQPTSPTAKPTGANARKPYRRPPMDNGAALNRLLNQNRKRKARIPREGWLARCLVDDRSRIIANLGNALVALREDPHVLGAFAFDEMAQETKLMTPLPAAPGGMVISGDSVPRLLRDEDVSQLQEWLQHHGLPRIGRDTVQSGGRPARARA